MAPLPLFVLIALVNVAFLLALAAGQMESGWSQRLTLLALVIAQLLAIVFVILAVFGHGSNVLQLVSIVGTFLAIPSAIGLVYLEYALVGRRKSFRRAMRESLWPGRYGVFKPFSWWP